jgi:hypothetical protein
MGRYSPLSGVTLDTRLTWSSYIHQVRKKAGQRLFSARTAGVASQSEIGVLLSKQQICPMIDYASHIWRTAACCHFRTLQSKYLRIAIGASSYFLSERIYEDLGVLFFADHIRALREFFNSNLADAGNPLFQQLIRYL